MTAGTAFPGNTASTFLTRFFGSGLVDERYVVERFKTLACGDIRPVAGEQLATVKKGAARIEWLSSSVRRLRGAAAENRASISAAYAEILADAEIGRYIHRTMCGVN